MPPKASCTTANNHRLGRTFSGCLTCRRRKVKCDSQLSRSSCGNCKRMKLACQASFWTNFKDLTPAHKGSRAYIVSPPDSPDDSLGQPQNSQSATDTSKPDRTISLTAAEPRSEAIPPSQGHDPSGPIDATASPRAISHLDQDDTEELLSSISNDFFPTADFQLADVDMSGLFQNSVLLMPQSEAFNPREWQFDHVLSAMASENLSPSCSSALWPPRGGYSYDRLTQPTIANGLIPTASNEQISSDSSAITEFPGFPEFPPLNMDGFSLATQIPAVITATEGTLVRHYELYMSKFLSVKDPQWNLYTYMLLSPQGSSESPLRHSLLAWSAFHVSSMKENSLEEGVKYYHAASMAVDDLIKEVTSLSETSISAVRLRMLLSATFFLCYCDIMSCRPDRFHSRLQRLKAAIFHNWSWVTAALSPITSRLLIWISYLEIRASLWDAQKSTSNPGRPEKLLIDGLSDRVSLSSFYANSGSYLEECFGDQYPTSELKQDLQQEAGNLKLLDVMTILGQIITFQTWDRGTFTNNNSMMNELRTTKIRLLQAELGRIRAELQQATPFKSTQNIENIDRTTFHWITVKALYLSASILLSRMLHPEIRTDRESQAAASELLKIARQLRQAQYLQTPRSFMWPLPIFIAGIETTDEFYQDWVVSYLKEMSGWGKNLIWVRRLLKGVLKQQGQENRRLQIHQVMEDLGCAMVV